VPFKGIGKLKETVSYSEDLFDMNKNKLSE